MSEPFTILVVDDDRDVRDTFLLVIERAGYRGVGAANGQEALDYLRGSVPPALILLDLMMPVMDGFQFRAEQRRDPRLAAIPVVVLTADPSAVPKAANLGVAESIRKPVDRDTLLRTIARHTA